MDIPQPNKLYKPHRQEVPPIQLARMTLCTVKAVAALEKECFSNPWSLDSLVEEVSNPLAVYYTATLPQSDEVVGYAGMHHIIDEGYITNIAVTARLRRHGVATALLGALIAYGQQQHLRQLTLEVRCSNTAAIALYKAFRFEPVGIRQDYYIHPTEDALLMTRHF